MKKLAIGFLALSAVSVSCKKNNDIEPTIPVSTISFNQKKIEILQKPGTTASIVLIGGFGSELNTWQKLYNHFPAGFDVFSYNRPGLGKSDDVVGKRDAITIANEIKTVLDSANIKPPYILVGHSMGGIYARIFYNLYPYKVKGIVLVDATHEKQLETLLSLVPPAQQLMIRQEMDRIQSEQLATMPAGSQKEEFRSNYQENYNEIKTFPEITNIPLYVITSTKLADGESAETKQITAMLHQQWAASAGTKGKFITTNKSGHFIQIEEPVLVLEGIQWILKQ